MLWRGGRTVLAAAGGFIWGAGGSVLIQQYGIWPTGIDDALVVGTLAALLSAGWAGRDSRYRHRLPASVTFALVPIFMVSLAQPGCDVTFVSDAGLASLGDTSATAPAILDPSVPTRAISTGSSVLRVDFDGAPFQRIPATDLGHGSADGAVEPPTAPGIYRVTAEVTDGCIVHGYVKIPGNPMDEPAGLAAAATIVVGLMLTGIAGCREERRASREHGAE